MDKKLIEQKIILKKLESMPNLPAPNEHLMNIMLIFRAQEVDTNKLVETLSRDQVIVARILKMINSSFYQLRYTIDSVGAAVTLLGLEKIKQVIYSSVIIDSFSEKDRNDWNHAYSTSLLISNILNENKGILPTDHLQLTALLHDIGKVVLKKMFPRKYDIVLLDIENNAQIPHQLGDPVHKLNTPHRLENDIKYQIPSYLYEDAVLSINHAVVGKWLMKKWGMVDEISEPIGYHHSDEVPENFAMETALLQFADWVDNAARGIHFPMPSIDLLNCIGLEIDKDYFIDLQKQQIEILEGNNKSEEHNFSKKEEEFHSMNPGVKYESEEDEKISTGTKVMRKHPKDKLY